MKNIFKLLGMIVLVVIGFTFTACPDGDGTGGNGGTTLIYKGVNSSGDEYELKITGDNYELTSGSNKSTGTVIVKTGTTYTLKPSVTATTFTATATSEGLRELAGSITWDNGPTVSLPGQLTVTGGSGGNGGGGGDDGQKLPAAVGKNEVGGKTYYRYYWNKVEFAKSSGSNGAFTVYSKRYSNDEFDLDANGKFKWNIDETGTYTWNESTKTLTLKVEKVSFNEYDDRKLLDKAGYKSYLLAFYGKDISVQEIDAELNEMFATFQCAYSLSNDGKALFMWPTLPQPNGTDELAGKMYYYARRVYNSDQLQKHPYQVFIFGANRTVTTNYRQFFDGYYANETISYSYESTKKKVYFCNVPNDWKKVAAEVASFYDSLTIEKAQQIARGTGGSANYFIDEAAYKAFATDCYFFYGSWSGSYNYDPVQKYIFSSGYEDGSDWWDD